MLKICHILYSVMTVFLLVAFDWLIFAPAFLHFFLPKTSFIMQVDLLCLWWFYIWTGIKIKLIEQMIHRKVWKGCLKTGWLNEIGEIWSIEDLVWSLEAGARDVDVKSTSWAVASVGWHRACEDDDIQSILGLNCSHNISCFYGFGFFPQICSQLLTQNLHFGVQ